MKLTAETRKHEFDKMLVVRPISKPDPSKVSFLWEDWQKITEHWEEGPFEVACFEVRKQGGFFPSIKEVESSYWQAVKDNNGNGSEQDDLEKEHRRAMRIHNETWAQLSCSKDFPWIMEQATDEIDAALEKLEKKNEDGHVIMDAKGQLAKLLRRHREESIRGRACEIWKETRE